MPFKSSVSAKLKIIARRPGYVFISHASEEKNSIIIPVTRELDKLKIPYYLDAHEIEWGRSLHQSLSNGLKHANYFLAFISETYVQKKWTMLELDAAVHCQASGRSGFILPVLIGNPQQIKRIAEQITFLMGLRHLVWNNNPSEIAISLAERLHRK